VFLILGLFGAISAGTEDASEPLTPEAAAAQLATSGVLHNVSVAGTLDLSDLTPEPGIRRLRLEGVRIVGYLQGPAPLPLEIVGGKACGLGIARDAQAWPAPISIQDALIGSLHLSKIRLGKFTCAGCRIMNGRFKGTRFAGPIRADLKIKQHDGLAGLCPELRTGGGLDVVDLDVSGGAVFEGDVDFRGLSAEAAVTFRAARFEGDTSFVGVRLAGRADFSGAQFRKSAEFRNCDIGTLEIDRGQSALLATAFDGPADFRNCNITETRLDFVTLAKSADFRLSRLARVEVGTISGPQRSLDLRTLQDVEYLRLTPAAVPIVDFYWHEIEGALTLDDTSGALERAIVDAVRANGTPLDARRASYALKAAAWQRLVDGLTGDGPMPEDREREIARTLEWGLWSWPTKEGTSLVRLLWLGLVLWALASLALLVHRRSLVRLPARGEPGLDAIRPWHEIVVADLPEGALCPLGGLRQASLTLAYAFQLCFLWSPGNLRHAKTTGDLHQSDVTYLRLLLWLCGKYLVLLAALTLAALTPALQGLLPMG